MPDASCGLSLSLTTALQGSLHFTDGQTVAGRPPWLPEGIQNEDLPDSSHHVSHCTLGVGTRSGLGRPVGPEQRAPRHAQRLHQGDERPSPEEPSECPLAKAHGSGCSAAEIRQPLKKYPDFIVYSFKLKL